MPSRPLTTPRRPSKPSGEAEPALRAGSCNLYAYPTVFSDEYPKGETPSPAGIALLRAIFVSLFAQPTFVERPDEVGAFAIHALVVCNSLALTLTPHPHPHAHRWAPFPSTRSSCATATRQ